MPHDLYGRNNRYPHPQSNLPLIAPPGCGKTELLAQRAAYLIPTLEPHQRILALTFSNRAKANLGERLLTGRASTKPKEIKGRHPARRHRSPLSPSQIKTTPIRRVSAISLY
jgi:ATP-dependent exoDNAse (exonuclease V) beta subunit